MSRSLRYVAGYLLVPFIPPVLLMLVMQTAPRDWVGGVLLYWPFGFAAMVALGTPMLLLFQRLGWTGFLPFMAGAGACAGIVTYFVMPAGTVPFALAGAVSGLAFRIMLYGLRPVTAAPATRSRAVQIAIASVSVVLAGASLLGLYSVSDSHRTVTEQMGWQCTGIQDTPHTESAKFWFLKNPNYEEGASGPHLCADLQAAAKQPVTMTFDVWGNRVKGLHGYRQTSVAVGSKRLSTDGFSSGGAHGGPSRNPLEVFK